MAGKIVYTLWTIRSRRDVVRNLQEACMRGKLKAAAVCAAVVVGFTAMANEKPSPEYQAAMKNLGAANAGMRGDVTNKDYAAIEKHAATYKASFTVADNYWSGKKVDDAMKLAK